MKSSSLTRVSLRLLTFATLLAAGGSLLRPKPLPPSKPAELPAPIVLTQAAYTSSKPLVPGVWAHLKQAKIERIIFPGYRVRKTDTYDWLPDGRALLVRYAEHTDHYTLYAASAKSVMPLRGFNRRSGPKFYASIYRGAYEQANNLPAEVHAPYCLLSPDGGSLLLEKEADGRTNLEGMNDHAPIMTLAALDGKMRREWDYGKVFANQKEGDDLSIRSDSCWLRDGKHWITPLIQYKEWKGFALIDSRRSPARRITRFREAIWNHDKLLGEAQDGNFLISAHNPDSWNSFVTRFQPYARNPTAECVTVHLPLTGRYDPDGEQYASFSEVRLSLKGDKLVWLLDFVSKGEVAKRALWFTKATGKFSGLSTPVEIPATIEPDSLRWMPDGRHLSFLKGETLYKVALP